MERCKMIYELKYDTDKQEILLYDLHFFGAYDESLFCNTLYTANLNCQFNADSVSITIPNNIMYWQANNLRQLLLRYGVPVEAVQKILGILKYNFKYN